MSLPIFSEYFLPDCIIRLKVFLMPKKDMTFAFGEPLAGRRQLKENF
jgi:hypothetical protein